MRMGSLSYCMKAEPIKKEEYDKEPVFYCAHCNSLKIIDIDGVTFCDECGSTDIKETDIYNWKRLKSKH